MTPAPVLIGAAIGWAAERAVMRSVATAGSPSLEATLPTGTKDVTMVTHDGGELHWIEAGTGTPMILLHGVTLEAQAWVRQFELADRCRVMAIDLRGHGRSVAGVDGATVAANAADLAQLLEDHDLGGAVLAGHSMGGMVVAHFLATAPAETRERVRGVAFVDSAVRSPVVALPGRSLLDRLLGGPLLGGLLGTVPDNDAGRLAVMATFGRRPRLGDLQIVADAFDRLSPDTYWQAVLSILDHDLRQALAMRTREPSPAMLVVVGDRDRLTPLRSARELVAAFPGSELRIVPGSGHQVMLEAPEAMNDVLAELLDAAPLPAERSASSE